MSIFDLNSFNYLLGIERIPGCERLKNEIKIAFETNDSSGLNRMFEEVSVGQFVVNGLANFFAHESIRLVQRYIVNCYYSKIILENSSCDVERDIERALETKLNDIVRKGLYPSIRQYFKEKHMKNPILLGISRQYSNKLENKDLKENSQIIDTLIDELYRSLRNQLLNGFDEKIPIFFGYIIDETSPLILKNIPPYLTADSIKKWNFELELFVAEVDN